MNEKCNIFFEYNDYLRCNTASIIIRINYIEMTVPMQKIDGIFFASIDIESEEFIYKYLINNLLRINDSDAPSFICESNGEVWSGWRKGEKRLRREIPT